MQKCCLPACTRRLCLCRQQATLCAIHLDVQHSQQCAGLQPLCCSGGLGNIDHRHLSKAAPQRGWLVVKIGGPAYRIGLGGGAASSVASGSNKADLDFNAVQVLPTALLARLPHAWWHAAAVQLTLAQPCC